MKDSSPPPDVVEVVVSPPYVFLPVVKSQLRPEFQVAAQNCWVKKGGAFTGEVSAEMLVNLGIPWVILGHSERRSLLGESSEALVFWSESLNRLLWNIDAKRSKGEEKLLVRESLSQGSALTYKRS